MTTTTTRAPGKCILFGEHAVVHNHPAIAVALNIFSECKISTIKQNKIILSLIDFEYYKEFDSMEQMLNKINKKWLHIPIGLQYMVERYKIDNNRLKIRIDLSSQLWQGAGLGSSASTSVALCSAISKHFNLGLDNSNISHCAFKCEEVVHGRPSGIDNSICAYGGVILFKNQVVERIAIADLPILIIYSNELHDTKQAIRYISTLLEEKPDPTKGIFAEIEKITIQGLNALESNDMKKLQSALHQNQIQLDKLQLSTQNINEILGLAKNETIEGIKITGAGAGGCLIAIDSTENLEQFATVLHLHNYDSILTSINHSGVQYD